MLPAEDRDRLRRMAAKAAVHGTIGHNRAYCKGVEDVLRWLVSNEEMTEMLREVTR